MYIHKHGSILHKNNDLIHSIIILPELTRHVDELVATIVTLTRIALEHSGREGGRGVRTVERAMERQRTNSREWQESSSLPVIIVHGDCKSAKYKG